LIDARNSPVYIHGPVGPLNRNYRQRATRSILYQPDRTHPMRGPAREKHNVQVTGGRSSFINKRHAAGRILSLDELAEARPVEAGNLWHRAKRVINCEPKPYGFPGVNAINAPDHADLEVMNASPKCRLWAAGCVL
jgi:hypothetical protein